MPWMPTNQGASLMVRQGFPQSRERRRFWIEPHIVRTTPFGCQDVPSQGFVSMKILDPGIGVVWVLGLSRKHATTHGSSLPTTQEDIPALQQVRLPTRPSQMAKGHIHVKRGLPTKGRIPVVGQPPSLDKEQSHAFHPRHSVTLRHWPAMAVPLNRLPVNFHGLRPAMHVPCDFVGLLGPTRESMQGCAQHIKPHARILFLGHRTRQWQDARSMLRGVDGPGVPQHLRLVFRPGFVSRNGMNRPP